MSMKTAATRTPPTTMFWRGASTPTIAIPDCSDCMMSAPRIAP